MGLLTNKNIIIMGVRNRWSLAWGIAQAAHEQGANLILTYLGEREKDDVAKLASTLGDQGIFKCDVSSDEDINNMFDQIKEKYGVVHGLVHSIAFAKAEDIQNGYVNTTRAGFAVAMDVSVYSLAAVANRAKDLMTEGGSMITLTFMGSERVIPGYNVTGVAKAALEASVMYLAAELGGQGIRVNGISAGPIKTFSAKGIKDFSGKLNLADQKSPLKRRIDQSDVGGAAVFLLSELSKGITGEIMYVDCGLNIVGM